RNYSVAAAPRGDHPGSTQSGSTHSLDWRWRRIRCHRHHQTGNRHRFAPGYRGGARGSARRGGAALRRRRVPRPSGAAQRRGNRARQADGRHGYQEKISDRRAGEGRRHVRRDRCNRRRLFARRAFLSWRSHHPVGGHEIKNQNHPGDQRDPLLRAQAQLLRQSQAGFLLLKTFHATSAPTDARIFTYMAQRKQRRTSWSRRALFYIFFPLVVWGIAFLVWFYWYDLRRVGKQDYTDRPKAAGDSDSEPKEL